VRCRNLGAGVGKRPGRMVRIGTPFQRGCFFSLLVSALVACRATSQPQLSAPRYLVTESPIDVGRGIGLCIAVDPAHRDGIWWWEPGATGCDSRSTGPGLFHGDGATVAQSTPSGSFALGFRLGTHSASRQFVDVRLVVEAERMRTIESGVGVSVQRQTILDVPLLPLRGRR
jgi:hypothetical protein